MAEAVYILCAFTSLCCATLLVRGYSRNRTRLLLWSALCFLCLALSNIMLVLDLIFFPTQVDLLLWRLGVTVVGLGTLAYGLVWEIV